MTNEIALRPKAEIPDLVTAAGQLTKICKKSRDTYSWYMKSFQNFCNERGMSPDLDAIERWLETYEKSSTKTIALAAIKATLKHLYKYDNRLAQLRIDLDDIQVVKKVHAISRAQYLTKKEVDKLIKAAPKNIGLMIEAFFWTALRCSELLSIELKNCTLVGRVYEIKVVGKGRKENLIYLEKSFFKKCNIFFGGKTFLFSHGDPEKKFTREFVSREIAKAGDQIGKNVSAHTLRHSAACYMRDEMKMPIDKISKALNHSDISVTAGFYMHGAPDAIERGVISNKKAKPKKRR